MLTGPWSKWSRTNGIDTSSKLLVTTHIVTAGLFASIRYSSEELLTLPWHPGEQAISGPKYLARIELSAAICVRPLGCSWTSFELTTAICVPYTIEFSSTELSSWKIYGFNIIVSIRADYSYACYVPDNTYLQSMTECYSVEILSCYSLSIPIAYVIVSNGIWTVKCFCQDICM